MTSPTTRVFLAISIVGCVCLARAGEAEEPHPLPVPGQSVVEVTAARLPDQTVDQEEVPASTTVITREEIERRGTRTVQDLLSLETGVVLHDDVGNDVQKVFDLRGFTGGSGCAVFLDGARVNDPRNNSIALESIPIEAIERIEIVRGSAAATVGGGSEAGVVFIETRRGSAEPSGSIGLAAGTYGATRYTGDFERRVGPVDLFFSGAQDATDGFRDNADGKQERFAGSIGGDLGGSHRLTLTLLRSDLDYGNPGALREDELAVDASASPYNSLDFTEAQERSATVNFVGPLSKRLSIAANLSFRDGDAQSLTTGRAAVSFGGFYLDSATRTTGSTVQLTHTFAKGSAQNRLVGGAEGFAGKNDSLGYFTSPSDPGSVDFPNPDSSNVTRRSTTALFVQDVFEPSRFVSLTGGVRYDRDHFEYDETLPDGANDDEKTFSEVSIKAGATWMPVPRLDAFVAYGESFLPPTAEQLFSFPLFFSNPALDPEDSRSTEVGVRVRAGTTRFEAALFRIDTDNEILFDPSAGTFGMNVNQGKTERRGLETSVNGSTRSLHWFVHASATDATLESGVDSGKTVPLVPKYRAATGIDAPLGTRLSLHADVLWVDEQVLDNDSANAQQLLPSYTVVNARIVWAHGRRGPRFFVEGRNLFDESYATRGIYASDLTTPFPYQNAVFLTPAPGRRWLVGADWRL